MSKNLLNIQDLKTYFYTSTGVVKAIDGVDLEVKKDESVGLVGESGCGKSTIALSILRLVPSPGKTIGGKIQFYDRNLLELTDEEMRRVRGRDISTVFQNPSSYLNPVLKIKDQIAETIRLHQGVKSGVDRKVVELLETVGIPSASRVAEYYPHQMSGGMQQRVMIAIALSCKPSLMIADEPTTALDVTVQAQILDLIKASVEKLGASFLLITHDLGIVADICEKVYVMYAGKIVEQADVFALFDNAKHPYTRGLLESALSIDELKENIVGIPGTVPDLTDPPPGCRFHPRCKWAKAICSQREPVLDKVENGHAVSCWIYS